MKAVIVHESMFGNTEALAVAVGEGLTGVGAEVVLVDVGAATAGALVGFDLLVLAAPTHALALSRPESRREAVVRGGDPRHVAAGVREWLDDIDTHLPASSGSPAVAVFDTRVSKVRHWPGSAARQAERIVRRHGSVVLARTSFFVRDVSGPLVDGELARARTWGSSLAGLLAARSGPGPVPGRQP